MSIQKHPTPYKLYHLTYNITMSPQRAVVLVVFVLCYYGALASDPDPVQDFCIPNTEVVQSNFHQCKNSSAVTVDDFIFTGIKNPGKKLGKNEFLAVPVSSSVFPGLNTLGMSFVRADFGPGGVNVPHFHPRATETAFVIEGKIYSGFVDTTNRIFAKVIEKGEVMVFPRGLVHFQMNVGDSPATILGSFDSQSPGLMKIPNAVFGSDIEEELLEKAFGLSSKEIGKLRKKFGTS